MNLVKEKIWIQDRWHWYNAGSCLGSSLQVSYQKVVLVFFFIYTDLKKQCTKPAAFPKSLLHSFIANKSRAKYRSNELCESIKLKICLKWASLSKRWCRICQGSGIFTQLGTLSSFTLTSLSLKKKNNKQTKTNTCKLCFFFCFLYFKEKVKHCLNRTQVPRLELHNLKLILIVLSHFLYFLLSNHTGGSPVTSFGECINDIKW